MLISLVGVVLAALLVCKHDFGAICQGSMGCELDGVDGCGELGKSEYSKIPFIGISFATAGLFYYLFLSVLFWRIASETDGVKKSGLLAVLMALAVFGIVLDSALAYINFTQLIVPCLLCIYTYLVTIGVLIIAVLLQRGSTDKDGSIMDGIKAAWMPASGSVAGVILFLVALTIASGGGGAQSSEKFGLLSEDKVKRRLIEFRALNKSGLSDKGLDSVEGADDAYIVIHKFADFRCPHCLHAGDILEAGLRRWPGRIKIYYRHFPLDGTCNDQVQRKQPGAWSCNGAQAALCAPEQGVFAKFYHGVFNFQRSDTAITLPALQKLAGDLGADWERMKQCMGSRATARKLERDIDDAIEIEISSTPTIVLQDRLLPAGTPDPTYFFQTLDALVFEKEGKPAYDEYRKRGNTAVNLPEGHSHGH